MGKIIAVLGLGESLKEFPNDDSWDYTIGVNDIWSKVYTNAVVCVDKPERFTKERLRWIDASRPQRFYSHLEDWKGRADYYPIELQPQYPNHICLINIPAVPKSLCSPFVAAAIAYKFHDADEIHLYGVDLVNHPLLDSHSCLRIVNHFTNLKYALKIAGCKLVVHGDGILKSLNN